MLLALVSCMYVDVLRARRSSLLWDDGDGEHGDGDSDDERTNRLSNQAIGRTATDGQSSDFSDDAADEEEEP